MAIYKSGNLWYGKCMVDGTMHNLPKSYSSKKDCAEALRIFKNSLKARKVVDRLAGIESIIQDENALAETTDKYANMTINHVFDSYVALGASDIATKAESSKKAYRRYVNGYVRYLRDTKKYTPNYAIKDITADDVSGFVSWMRQQGHSQNYMSSIIFFWRRMFDDFKKVSTHRIFQKNPFAAVGVKQEKRIEYRQPFAEDEIKRLYDTLSHPINKQQRESYPHLMLFTIIAKNTGLRKVDVCNLKWSDVDLNKRMVVVTPRKTEKTNGETVIPMSNELYDALIKRRAEVDADAEYVDDYLKAVYDSRWIDGLYRNVLVRSGIEVEKVVRGKKHTIKSAHSWRHYFISSLADRGVGEQTIRSMVSHSSIDIHRAYTHIHAEAKIDAISKLNQDQIETVTISRAEYERLKSLWDFLFG